MSDSEIEEPKLLSKENYYTVVENILRTYS